MRRNLFPRSSRPHRKLRRVSYGQAAKTTGNQTGCSLPLSARNCGTSPLADRLTMKKKREDFSVWSAEVTAVTASPSGEPSESPRHFAASMDESVIVGYYTLKKCLSVVLRCLQISKKVNANGKKRWNRPYRSQKSGLGNTG